MKPLIYLELRHLVNSIKHAARRPKRLIPVVIIALWVLVSIVQSVVMAGEETRGADRAVELLQDRNIPVEILEPVLVVLLTVGCAAVLYGSFSSGMLVFSLAHIDFLFPLPIHQRWVLTFKLARDYLKYAVWVAFLFTVIGTSAFGALGVAFLPWGLLSILGLVALIIFVVNLAHIINTVFTFGFARLAQHGRAARAALIAVPVALILYLLRTYLSSAGNAAEAWEGANSLIVGVVLAPVKVCAQLMLAPLRGVVFPDDYVLLGFLAALAGLSFLALITRKENIYEPSLGTSVQFAARREAVRSGDYARMLSQTMAGRSARRLAGAALPPFGRGAGAFFWKNLVVRLRAARSQALFVFVMPVLGLALVKLLVRGNELIQYLPVLLIYGVWITAMSLHLDARSEMRYANTSKSVPVEAWKIVLAQAGAYAVYLTLTAVAFGTAIVVLLPQTRSPIAAASLAGAPFVGFATIPAVIIPSMLYPDTRDSVQNYLCGIVSTLLSVMAVAPGTVIAAVLWFAGGASLGTIVAAGCVVHLATGIVGTGLAGIVFEGFEPTGE